MSLKHQANRELKWEETGMGAMLKWGAGGAAVALLATMAVGTVPAQALNFSQSPASPVQNDSSTPLARIARHL